MIEMRERSCFSVKRMISALLTLALFLSLSVPARAAQEFTDVPQSHIFHDTIQSCVARGLLSGYGDGTFHPATPVTRAQFAVMLARIFYPGEAESGAYDTWKSVGWYAPSCAALKSHDAMAYGDKYWTDPGVMNSDITRRDMALFLNACLKAGGYQASGSDKTAVQSQILDYAEVGDYYADAVKTVYALGIITGYGDGRFMGRSTMTRGQAAAILDRTVRCVAQGPGVLTPLVQEQPAQSTTLANGQDITEENVLAILEQLRSQYPENTNYAAGYPQGNDSVVRAATYPYERSRDPQTHTSNTLGCGGWSTQISDAVFGQTGFLCRKVDMRDARPSDIMVIKDADGRLVHVATITARSTVQDGAVTMYITEAATDDNGVYHLHWDRFYTWYQGGEYDYDIYTRYPE